MFRFLTILVALTLCLNGAKKPNFILIFTDDQGYNDLSCFGSTKIKTPHLDQLAKEGRKLTSFYVASPVCTPSRAALLTGCYPKRIGMENHVIFPKDRYGMHQEEVTIADMLKGAGYSTACVGKWHLGHRKPFLPTSQGFDLYWGIPYSNDMNHPNNENKPPYWGPEASDKLWLDQKSAVTKWKTPLMEGEKIIEMPVDQQTITRRYTDKAIEFITANKEKPFFLYLPHSMPHVPLYVPDDVLDKDPRNAYTNTIEHIDTECGRLFQTIKDLGLSENTYIIFTTDNGPWLPFEHHGGSALPLRDGKASTYEGGQRVPFIIKGPGVTADSISDGIGTTMDLLPSIAKLAGIEVKTRGPIDGIDISGLLTTEEKSPRTEFLYYSSRGKLEGMRQGDWKLLTPWDSNTHKERLELYNLAKDIGEEDNRAKAEPERFKKLFMRMHELHLDVVKGSRQRGPRHK